VPEAERAHLWKQDEIWKVQGELEELRKRLQEEVPEAERAHLWKKEDLLMKKKEQLRQKELLLMQSGQNSTALVQQVGHNNNSLVQQPAQNTPISRETQFTGWCLSLALTHCRELMKSVGKL
jgi:hypothetical protein